MMQRSAGDLAGDAVGEGQGCGKGELRQSQDLGDLHTEAGLADGVGCGSETHLPQKKETGDKHCTVFSSITHITFHNKK